MTVVQVTRDVLTAAMPPTRTGAEKQTTGVICPTCEDFGFVRDADARPGDANFGVPIRCPDCNTALLRRMEALHELSGVQGDLAKCTFDNFEKVKGVGEALKAAMQWAAKPEGWIVLSGPYGNGKSHLAAAANNALEASLKPVLFVVVPDLLDHLRATFAPGSTVEYDQLFETVKAVPILIMDDLAAENPTAWAMEKLYQILDYRTRLRLPTLITTNLLMSEFEGRLGSRLCNHLISWVVENRAEDYRRSKRPEFGKGGKA